MSVLSLVSLTCTWSTICASQGPAQKRSAADWHVRESHCSNSSLLTVGVAVLEEEAGGLELDGKPLCRVRAAA